MKDILRTALFLLFVSINIAAFSQTTGSTLPAGSYLLGVEDIQMKWVVEGDKNNVQIRFNETYYYADSKSIKHPLTSITKITVERSIAEMSEYSTVFTLDNPKPGEKQTMTDKDLAYGSYDYLFHVYVGEECDFGTIRGCIVGEIAAEMNGAVTATVDKNNAHNVIIETVLPTKNTQGEDLKMPITKVVFGEANPMSGISSALYTETAEEVLVPGTKLSYTVKNVTDGSHVYTVQVFTEAGGNYPGQANVFVGNDAPGAVKNLTAQQTEDGIVITWEPPTSGMNGGNLGNVSNISYTLKRGASVYDNNAVVLLNKSKNLTYTDKTTFTEEARFVYIVYATNLYGDGTNVTTKEFVVGPASTLPFTESFDVPLDSYGNCTTEHSTWTMTTTGMWGIPAWQLGQSTYMDNDLIMPHNGNGLLFAFYNQYMNKNSVDTYTSGSIDFSSCEEPTLTFWLYDVKHNPSDISLSILSSANEEEFVENMKMVVGKAEEDGWKMISVNLSNLKNVAKGRITFKSVSSGSNSFPVIIDEINIFDAKTNGIKSVDVKHFDGTAYNLNGQRVDKNTKGIIIVNGKKIFNK